MGSFIYTVLLDSMDLLLIGVSPADAADAERSVTEEHSCRFLDALLYLVEQNALHTNTFHECRFF
jgi:hypothetical protein